MFDTQTATQLEQLHRQLYTDLDRRYDRLTAMLRDMDTVPHWTSPGQQLRAAYAALKAATAELHETMTAIHHELEHRRSTASA